MVRYYIILLFLISGCVTTYPIKNYSENTNADEVTEIVTTNKTKRDIKIEKYKNIVNTVHELSLIHI